MIRMRLTLVCIAGLLVFIGLSGCSNESSVVGEGEGERAAAMMAAPDGSEMGTVELAEGPNGVLVSADVRGLTAGPHGFHIHAVGACAPDFSAAGGHFAPEDRGHGFMDAEGSHAGDLPNIHAHDDGTARADFQSDRVTLADGSKASLFDDDGAAIIIHAKPDTYGAEAGAGDRVACGVIERN